MNSDLLLIILSAIASALVVAPISFRPGWRAKDARWCNALDYLQTHGLAVIRRKNPNER